MTVITLSNIREGNENIQVKFLQELKKKQKLVQESTYKSFVVQKSENFI